jgi:hypothetical protein
MDKNSPAGIMLKVGAVVMIYEPEGSAALMVASIPLPLSPQAIRAMAAAISAAAAERERQQEAADKAADAIDSGITPTGRIFRPS